MSFFHCKEGLINKISYRREESVVRPWIPIEKSFCLFGFSIAYMRRILWNFQVNKYWFCFLFVCFIIYQVLPGEMIIHSMLLVRNSQPFTKSKPDALIYLHLKDLTQAGKSSIVFFLPGSFFGRVCKWWRRDWHWGWVKHVTKTTVYMIKGNQSYDSTENTSRKRADRWMKTMFFWLLSG